MLFARARRILLHGKREEEIWQVSQILFLGCPKKNWVVGVKIDLDFSELEGADLTTEEITKACLAHLNTPPPRRKYAKKSSNTALWYFGVL